MSSVIPKRTQLSIIYDHGAIPDITLFFFGPFIFLPTWSIIAIRSPAFEIEKHVKSKNESRVSLTKWVRNRDGPVIFKSNWKVRHSVPTRNFNLPSPATALYDWVLNHSFHTISTVSPELDWKEYGKNVSRLRVGNDVLSYYIPLLLFSARPFVLPNMQKKNHENRSNEYDQKRDLNESTYTNYTHKQTITDRIVSSCIEILKSYFEDPCKANFTYKAKSSQKNIT